MIEFRITIEQGSRPFAWFGLIICGNVREWNESVLCEGMRTLTSS